MKGILISFAVYAVFAGLIILVGEDFNLSFAFAGLSAGFIGSRFQ